MVLLLGYCALALLAVGGRAAFVLLRDIIIDRRIAQVLDRTLRRDALNVAQERRYAERVLRSRALDLKERELKTQESRQRSPAVPTSIPSDLYRRITKWESPDAQDAERKVLLDLYSEFRDAPDPWVEVRAHLSPEPSDQLSDDIFREGIVS